MIIFSSTEESNIQNQLVKAFSPIKLENNIANDHLAQLSLMLSDHQ